MFFFFKNSYFRNLLRLHSSSKGAMKTQQSFSLGGWGKTSSVLRGVPSTVLTGLESVPNQIHFSV